MQVSNTRTGTDDAREGIINSLIEWSKGSQDPELLELVDLYRKVNEAGTSNVPALNLNDFQNQYDLEGMEDSGNHVSNIYAVLRDGIPRTTSKSRNKLTGVIDDSALHRELYQRFKCCPSDRAIMARISNIRNNTTSTPSVVYATETINVDSQNYKRRFYFLIEDGLGRSGSVSTEECPKWHLRRK